MVFYILFIVSLLNFAPQFSLAAPADDVLAIHNQYRARHHSPPLKWNDQLATDATSWSKACKFEHSNGPYSENLAIGQPSWDSAIGDWYNENTKYDYNNPGYSPETGHFTAMVWKSSTDLGCGIADCSGRPFYTCRYTPQGNIVNDGNTLFRENVLQP